MHLFQFQLGFPFRIAAVCVRQAARAAFAVSFPRPLDPGPGIAPA